LEHAWDQEGRNVASFEGLAEMGKNFFKSLYKAEQRVNIVEIVRLALYYPSFVDAEKNRELFEEVSEPELKETLHSFQKDKSPGPDGWPIEFYLGFYELLGADLLQVVEESRRKWYDASTLQLNLPSTNPKKG
jgi:hypothetical protein